VYWALSLFSGYQNTILYQEMYLKLPFEHVERASQVLSVSQQAGALTGALGAFVVVLLI
jgi:hypothetical protein